MEAEREGGGVRWGEEKENEGNWKGEEGTEGGRNRDDGRREEEGEEEEEAVRCDSASAHVRRPRCAAIKGPSRELRELRQRSACAGLGRFCARISISEGSFLRNTCSKHAECFAALFAGRKNF